MELQNASKAASSSRRDDAAVRVIYDLSPLETAVRDRSQYTGIQRVVYEVAAGLATDPSVRLTIRAETAGLQAAARNDEKLARSTIIDRPLSRFTPNSLPLQSDDTRGILSRCERSVVSRYQNALRSVSRFVEMREMRQFQIYHSPQDPFPTVVRESKHLRRFLTVYDVTPLIMPQYALATAIPHMRSVIASITPDDFFLCISQSTKADWCEHTKVSAEHCFVTPLGAADNFRPVGEAERILIVKRQYGVPDEGRYILSLGTLEPRKNLATVVAAFVEFCRQTQVPDVFLVLVGRPGWKTEAIFATLPTDDALRARIIFTGYVPEEDLAPLYSGARAFLYMSFYEGFGLPPLEAMQCGVPVICSNTSSLPEVVGDAGILLPPDDVHEVCDAMRRVIENDELCAKMRAKSLERAGQFSWQICLERTVAAYRKAIHR